jgi:hypothetical protein
MKLNVDEFKNLLEKATLNNSIESVQLIFKDNGNVESKMISTNKDAVAMLDIKNTVLEGAMGDVEFNFVNPNKDLIPFLSLLDDNTVNINIKDEKIIIVSGNQKLDIHFCSPQIVSKFEGKMDDNIKPFLNMEINDVFTEAFSKIKKVGSRFGFVYFSVKKGVFYIETTDKKNKFSNGLRLDIMDGVDSKDLTLCFNYKNMANMFSVISDSISDFSLNFYYMESHNAGMIRAEKNDKSEVYVVMSVIGEDN